jgi:hypothetical protein
MKPGASLARGMVYPGPLIVRGDFEVCDLYGSPVWSSVPPMIYPIQRVYGRARSPFVRLAPGSDDLRRPGGLGSAARGHTGNAG